MRTNKEDAKTPKQRQTREVPRASDDEQRPFFDVPASGDQAEVVQRRGDREIDQEELGADDVDQYDDLKPLDGRDVGCDQYDPGAGPDTSKPNRRKDGQGTIKP